VINFLPDIGLFFSRMAASIRNFFFPRALPMTRLVLHPGLTDDQRFIAILFSELLDCLHMGGRGYLMYCIRHHLFFLF